MWHAPQSADAGRVSIGEVADKSWRRIAERQAGVISLEQLSASGVSRSAVHRLVMSDVLRRVRPEVYALIGAPVSLLQDAWAAQLWSRDGVLCARTAARLLELDVSRYGAIEIMVPRRMRSPGGDVRLWRGDVDRPDLATVRGLRVTTMPRTVIDCARVLPEHDTDVVLDSAIRQGMRRSVFLSRMEAICVGGRPGGRLIRKLVGERETEQGLTGSAFERSLLRAIKKAGLPMPVCQWPCVDAGFHAYIDLAYPEFGIAIEADGYRWHDGRRAFEADRRRVSELASRGWRVIHVTWLRLKYEPEAVVAGIQRALRTPALVQLRA